MGKKRVTLASGRSCSGMQKVSHKNKPSKKLRNVPNKKTRANELENKCTISNAGTKDLQNNDASIETSKDYVRPSVTTSGNCNSPLVTNDVHPPVKSVVISHDMDDIKCAHKLVMGPLEREYLKKCNDHPTPCYLGITYKRKNKVDFRKDEGSFIFKVTVENQAPQSNTSANNSLIRTAEAGQFKNIIEAPFTNESILVSCIENSCRKMDVDVAHASSIEHEDHSNTTILEGATTSKYGQVYNRKRWKNVSSGNNSAALSGMFWMLPILNGSNEASLTLNQVSSADKETKAVNNLYPDSEMQMPPQSNSAPNLTDETQSVDTMKYNMACDMIVEERTVSGCEHETQEICPDVNSTLQPIATSLNLDGSNMASGSDDFKRKITVSKCVTDEESISNSVSVENLLDRHLAVSTDQENELDSSPSSPVMKHISCVTVLNCETNEESTSNSVAVHNTENLLYRYHDGQENELDSSPMSPVVKHVSSDTTEDQLKCSNLTTLSLAETLLSCPKKKLIILDLNGLLADINQDYHYAHKAHNKVGGKFVFIRPYCDDFLEFCFERFRVGVWSSRIRRNVDAVVDCLMGNLKRKLLFCWDQSRCTVTGHGTIENMNKPLLLKELNKLWNKEDPQLPWEKGEYSRYNTLLVDDSPCKSICNPPHTAIFPYPYNLLDENDNSLGPGGDLRVYLEGVAIADDVQIYVRGHPFGQKAIEDSDPHWNFYRLIIEKVRDRHH